MENNIINWIDKEINDKMLDVLQMQIESIFWKNNTWIIKKYSMYSLYWVRDEFVLSVRLSNDSVFYRNGQFDLWILDWEKKRIEDEYKIMKLKEILKIKT